MFATITETVEAGSSTSPAFTAAAVVIPLVLVCTMLGLFFLWIRRRRNHQSQLPHLFAKWNCTKDGGPSSPRSAELAFVEKMEQSSRSSRRNERSARRGLQPGDSKTIRMVDALSPRRKHAPYSHRRAQSKRPKTPAQLERFKSTISAPSNFEHRVMGKKECQKLLAEQLNSVTVLQQPASDSFDTPLPPYSNSAVVKRFKPAPLDIAAAISAGKAMVIQNEHFRQQNASKPPVQPRPVARKRRPSREDVPKALQPRVRSLRRKPIPLAPLPKVPGDAQEALADNADEAMAEDSPIDRPLSRQSTRSNSHLRPESTSTFFCQGLSAPAAADSAQEKSSPKEQTGIKKLSVPFIDPRLSVFSAATSAAMHIKCQAPPNSLAGSAFATEDSTENQGRMRRSARQSMLDRMCRDNPI